ncbi:MAG: 50S ribosomal protein L15 [Candidatus Latescibacteria bacterium]|nr:50S ribosomal protein L15 [Candidatus Latescibacterota bacterium]NIM20807.1 50S ribosomal protein L15 [Candidatus Latescibacterota bacterium]NIM64373.1 50S ribosomal protein L15 [Candidatus Latescibacterota bacterium]NIO00524.1 50S ribosomal protein L15 [Candidatus Latescibacterota bacterium]NIO26927.1 50S ribosomal protein L15 [Candidatus Latescibacterota bacterium]
MKLGELKGVAGAKKKRKRIGCGPGSGHGKTACKGSKGQRSRSGSSIPSWFEGGQMPLQRRVPKRGFTNIFKVPYQVVNVGDLDRFPADSEINLDSLLDKGLVKKVHRPVKLLGNGKLDRPLKVIVHACSKKAREIVEKAGGEVRLVD